MLKQGAEDLNPEKQVKGFPWMEVMVLSYLNRESWVVESVATREKMNKIWP